MVGWGGGVRRTRTVSVVHVGLALLSPHIGFPVKSFHLQQLSVPLLCSSDLLSPAADQSERSRINYCINLHHNSLVLLHVTYDLEKNRGLRERGF